MLSGTYAAGGSERVTPRTLPGWFHRLTAKPAQTYVLQLPQITDAEESDEMMVLSMTFVGRMEVFSGMFLRPGGGRLWYVQCQKVGIFC